MDSCDWDVDVRDVGVCVSVCWCVGVYGVYGGCSVKQTFHRLLQSGMINLSLLHS